ncbi:MAG: hypothetical protein AAFV71_21625 [Cyanobacteria bacterium J06633_8]
MQNAAPQLGKRHFNQNFYDNYSRNYQNNQYSQKPKIRYPYSQGSINLSKHCPYCNYERGLIIIRYEDDAGFCKCGKCDAALFSLNESKPEQGLQHIRGILDSYLPTSTEADGEAAR